MLSLTILRQLILLHILDYHFRKNSLNVTTFVIRVFILIFYNIKTLEFGFFCNFVFDSQESNEYFLSCNSQMPNMSFVKS